MVLRLIIPSIYLRYPLHALEALVVLFATDEESAYVSSLLRSTNVILPNELHDSDLWKASSDLSARDKPYISEIGCHRGWFF